MSTLDTDFQALVARFEEGVSADPTKNMSPEDAAKWKAMNEEHGDKFKTATDQLAVLDLELTAASLVMASGWDPPKLNSELARSVSKGNKTWGPSVLRSLDDIRDAIGKAVASDLSMSDRVTYQGDIKKWKASLSDDAVRSFFRQVEKLKSPKSRGSDEWLSGMKSASEGDEQVARFEEGVSADPTKDMSPEDAKKWRDENEKHKDQFKTATEFDSPEALKQYLKDHPNADKSKHTVKDSGKGSPKTEGHTKPIEMSREGYKAVSTSLQGFEKPGAWQHVISFATAGKPLDPKHVKAVIADITDDLKNWKTTAGVNGWTAADKKNLTKAKGVLEGNLAHSQGKTAFVQAPITKPIRLTTKELSRAETATSADLTYTFVVRPQPDGKFLVALVDVVTGKVVFGTYYMMVDDKGGIQNAVRLLSRDIEKNTGAYSNMTDKSRHRYKPSEMHLASLGDGILAEGCPDNLDESECSEWEANTEQYGDKFKTAASDYTLSIAPDGTPRVDGYSDDVLFAMIIAKIHHLRPNQVVPVGRQVSIEGKRMSWQEALQDAYQTYSGESFTGDLALPPGRAVRVRVKVDSIYENGMKAAYEEGSRVPDGWDNGHIDGEAHTDEPGDEGSQIPDGGGNQRKRATTTKAALSYAGDRIRWRNRFFSMFFQEKQLPIVHWSLRDKEGTPHEISNQVVLEFIAVAPPREQKGIEDMIRKLDFANRDVNGYLKHLAGALINNPDFSMKLAATPLDEGDSISEGNQRKRALGEVTDNDHYEIYALVTPDGAMIGATDNWSLARKKAFWARYPGWLDNPGSTVRTLMGVPTAMAERFIDVGTRASRFTDGYTAWVAAKRYSTGQAARLAAQKEAGLPSGLYGHTKRIQADCDGCVRKVQKSAARIAKAAYGKHEGVAEFLSVHAKRADSLPAKILVAALREIGPRIASDMAAAENRDDRLAELRLAKLGDDAKTLLSKMGSTPVDLVSIAPQGVHFAKIIEAAENLHKFGFANFDGMKIAKVTDGDAQTGEGIKQTTDKTAGSGSANAKYLDGLAPSMKVKILKAVAAHYGVSVREIEGELTDRDAEDLYEYLAFDNGMAMQVYQDFKRMRLASGKTAGRNYGLYGYAEKVASLGLQACSDLRHDAGRHAYDLHSRRTAHHAAINDYFTNHSKQAKCMYSKLLAASYPAMGKSASEAPRTVQAWLEWE